MDIVDKVKYLLENKKISQKKLAEELETYPANISDILKRKGRKFQTEHIPKLAKIFDVSVDYLLGVDEIKKPVKTIPVVGTTSCGSVDINHYQDSDRVCYYNGEHYKKSLYCVIANGESMSPEIEDGDEIICDPDAKPQNGDMVHYTIGNESAVKVYVKDEDAYIVQFIPYNSNENFKTKTIRLDDDEAHKIKISKVVAVNKLKFNNRASRLRMIGR